jgi:hypothetical protein
MANVADQVEGSELNNAASVLERHKLESDLETAGRVRSPYFTEPATAEALGKAITGHGFNAGLGYGERNGHGWVGCQLNANDSIIAIRLIQAMQAHETKEGGELPPFSAKPPWDQLVRNT